MLDKLQPKGEVLLIVQAAWHQWSTEVVLAAILRVEVREVLRVSRPLSKPSWMTSAG